METPKLKKNDFVHLHLHSDYSLLQSTIQLKPLAKRAAELEMAACALTDKGNMFGAISFYKELKSAGVKPIIGYEANFVSGSREERSSSVASGERAFYPFVLLAADMAGYQNLVDISSRAYTEGLYHTRARVDLELLAGRSSGLIALSGGWAGPIAHYLQQGADDKAAAAASQFREIFGPERFFLEIEHHDVSFGAELNKKIADLAKRLDIGLVATNNVHYLSQDDARAHEVLMCIGEGRTLNDPARPTLSDPSYYMRSAAEMWEIFGSEYPAALENTLKIAEMCDLKLSIGDAELILPEFPIPVDSGCTNIDEYFRLIANEGLVGRKTAVLDPMLERGQLNHPIEAYQERLDLEIKIIEGMGYSGYFLIVWDFIRYAIEKNIPVGPGRGSAAGSLVAYSMGITDIDPLQYDLFFERFLNPERVSMPDIDIDFCIRGRGEVISHVSELYGRESVCQIITFMTMASKAAIKDVGRVLNMPLRDVEKVAKMIPPPFRGRNISISQALEQVPELKAAVDTQPEVKDLIELALRLEGCSRNTSVHAAGVVIAPKPLHQIVPVAVSQKYELTSQYPMGDLEKVGMLKMDFLGLTTLTIIADCLATLREKESVEIDWTKIPLTDEKTMQLFGEGKTDAVFQFESSGMQEICRRLKPKELEDLSALNALYRPGPLDGGMVEEFILRHKGEKEVQYLIPEMEDILRNTYGVLVYQEQIMQLAQKLAGYSLGEADLMRRAMGKKNKAEMDVHERKFIDGAIERGVAKRQAKEIFDLMAKFADYGFNRSHSIAYAYLAFQTAYLKAHHPAHFYAAVLSHEADDSAKVYKYSNELRSMGLELLPPDVNESDEGFTPAGRSVRFGLSAIKGMGMATALAIIGARGEGRFKSIYDLVSRIGHGAINRRSLESLIAAGALDTMRPDGVETNKWRAQLFAAIDDALSYGQSVWSDRERGQSGLFAVAAESSEPDNDRLPDVPPWTQAEIAAKEKATVGFYLSVHPLDEYKTILEGLRVTAIADHPDISAGRQIVVAGVVSALQVRWSKKGNRYAQFRIEDQSTGLKCLMWAEAYGKFADVIENDALLIIEGKVESADGQEVTVMVSEVRSLADSVSRHARSVVIDVPGSDAEESFLQELCSVLNQNSGRCEVFLRLIVGGVSAKLISNPLRVQGSRQLENQLKKLGCSVKWEL